MQVSLEVARADRRLSSAGSVYVTWSVGWSCRSVVVVVAIVRSGGALREWSLCRCSLGVEIVSAAVTAFGVWVSNKRVATRRRSLIWCPSPLLIRQGVFSDKNFSALLVGSRRPILNDWTPAVDVAGSLNSQHTLTWACFRIFISGKLTLTSVNLSTASLVTVGVFIFVPRLRRYSLGAPICCCVITGPVITWKYIKSINYEVI